MLLACGGEGDEAKGSYNALCSSNNDCGEGLLCVGAGVSGRGMCTSACAADPDCMNAHGPDAKCVGAGVGAGVCYDQCMDSLECPRTHVCNMSPTEPFSTCRPSPNN